MLKDRVLDIYPDTQWANGPPLTPAVLHILMVVLAHGEAHGYAIMKQVEVDSDGRVKMGPGTLYGSLKRMIDRGLSARPARRPMPTIAPHLLRDHAAGHRCAGR